MNDSRLSSVLHVLLHMAHKDTPMTSQELALCLGTHQVVVRRTMGLLRDAQIVQTGRGRSGGWRLAADWGGISLFDLYKALGAPPLFAFGNRKDATSCNVEQAVNTALNSAAAEAEALLLARYKEITLADLATDFGPRFARAKEQGNQSHV